MANQHEERFIPGMRVEIRDAEWRIQRVDRASDGSTLLDCVGISELVRGRGGKFLTNLESSVQVLAPEETELVDDLSNGYQASKLFIATALRQTPPTGEKIYMGHEAAMDLLPFQLDPTIQALKQPRQRILIADSVGLGKTLQAGILVSELIRRGRGKRILVLATKSMLGQFQMEFWQRFTIPLTRLDSVGLQRVRNQIPTNHNPFHYFDRSIISIDTLKQTLEYRHYLEQAYWDIIIIDEAHNVAKRSNNSQRHNLAKLLATQSDTMLMLSATPHDGKPKSFASLIGILDPTAIVNEHDYSHEDFSDRGLVVRRFKHDVSGQLATNFPPREIDTSKIIASPDEERVFELIAQAKFKTLDNVRRSGGALFRTTLEKAMFSSPYACLSTVKNRLKVLAKKEGEIDTQKDIDTLNSIASALEVITPNSFSKYQLLMRLLSKTGEDSLGWTRKKEDRLVIFTESLVTLDFLKEHLVNDLRLRANQLQVLTGTMKDTDLAEVVETFGQKDKSIRVLLCSDVASEGINLHHLSHRMIHFDIPWSLMVFQQRNGRIDRYGQTQMPQIRYLMTESANSEVRGDQRVLEVLIDKDSQAGKNIGDPSEFMRLFNPEEEEARTAEVMEKAEDALGKTIEDMLFGSTEEVAKSEIKPYLSTLQVSQQQNIKEITAPTPRLYQTDYLFVCEALKWLKAKVPSLNFTVDNEKNLIDLHAPADLQQRIKFMPKETRPADGRFILTTDKRAVQDRVKLMRETEDGQLAELHYLWQLHPVMEWLMSRISDAFGRHSAPVIRLPSRLETDEHWYIVQGGFPNKRGQALIQQTVAVQVVSGEISNRIPALELLRQLEMDRSQLANPGISGNVDRQKSHLKSVVDSVSKSLRDERDRIETQKHEQLRSQFDKLQELRMRHFEQLEIDLSHYQIETIKKRKEEDRRTHIERVFDEYKTWIEETQRTENDPYIQIVAVITGNAH